MWKNRIYECIKVNFGNKIFRTHDVLRVNTKYSTGTIYRAIHDLIKAGRVERLGRGMYRVKSPDTEKTISDRMGLSDKVIIKLLPGAAVKAKEILRSKGIEFMITGEPIFYRYIHNLPRRMVVLIYVLGGSGEFTAFSLKEKGLRVLTNPSANDFKMALDNISESDIFVIREFADLRGNIEGVASLERALVDLYFETSRKKIMFPEEEVGRIFLSVLQEESISYSSLLTYAGRRGIRKEIQTILDFVSPSISSKAAAPAMNKLVTNFLDIMRKEEWR